MSVDEVQQSIERALAHGPTWAERILAEGGAAVALEGELIVELHPDGSRQVIGTPNAGPRSGSTTGH